MSDDDIVLPEYPTVLHKMTFEDCKGLGFDENTANVIAYCINPTAWKPCTHNTEPSQALRSAASLGCSGVPPLPVRT